MKISNYHTDHPSEQSQVLEEPFLRVQEFLHQAMMIRFLFTLNLKSQYNNLIPLYFSIVTRKYTKLWYSENV